MLLFLLIAANGCSQTCKGAGCEDLYTSLDLWRLDAETIFSETQPVDPLQSGTLLLKGDADAGRNWRLLPYDGDLLIGQPDRNALLRLHPEDASVVAEVISTETNAFGTSLALYGDTLMVGAPRYAPGTDGADGGALYLLAIPTESGSADLTRRTSGQVGERLGTNIAGCGDLDNDGLGDLVVQAAWGDSAGTLSGDLLFLPSATPRPLARSDFQSLAWSTDDPGARLGATLNCHAVLGTSDTQTYLIAGAPYGANTNDGQGSGKVLLWKGGQIGEQPITLYGLESSEYFGYSIATGDLNGNGAVDLVVGAPGHDPTDSEQASLGISGMAGAVYVFLDQRLSLAVDIGFPVATIAPSFVFQINYDGVSDNCSGLSGEDLDFCDNAHLARLGATVAVADMDGDGVDDLLVGAPGWRASEEVELGRLWVLKGPSSTWAPPLSFPIATTWYLDISTIADATIVGTERFEQVGDSLVPVSLGGGAADLLLMTRRSD